MVKCYFVQKLERNLHCARMTKDDLKSTRTSYAGVFFALFVGYCTYTVARRAVVIVTRDLQAQMLLSNSDIGAINSSFSIAYGMSKFFAGVATDLVSPKLLFAGGLFFAGLSNLAFPYSTSLLGFCFFWFLNGLAQGCGWPSLSKIMLRTFPPSIRGSAWGFLTMGGNVGQSISPVALTYLYFQYGWRFAFFVPGIVAMLFAFVSYTLISYQQGSKVGVDADKILKKKSNSTESNEFRTKVLRSRKFWLLIFADVLIYFILKALGDWTIKLVKEDRDYNSIVASTCLSAYETGGVVGTLLTGLISDRLGSRRNLTSFIYSLVLLPALLALYALPKDTPIVAISTALFLIGFGVYGPKTLCGLAVRETHAEAAGTAGGFLGLAGQVGASIAGYPLGIVVDRYGWNSLYYIMIFSSSLVSMLFYALLDKRIVSKKTKTS